jgi:hypothetical protein
MRGIRFWGRFCRDDIYLYVVRLVWDCVYLLDFLLDG